MGSTQMLYALTREKTREYLRENVNLFVALAPVTQIAHHDSPLLWLLHWFQDEIWWIAQRLKWYEVLGEGDNTMAKFVCAVANPICLWSTALIFDGNPSYEDANRYQVYVAHSFKGVSIKSIYHLAQNAKDGIFREFDYGEKLNQKYYGKLTAPVIDLSSVGLSGIPIAMFQRS